MIIVCIVVTGSCCPARHVYEYKSGEFDVRRELFMFHSCYDIQLWSQLFMTVYTCISASNQYILSQL